VNDFDFRPQEIHDPVIFFIARTAAKKEHGYAVVVLRD
jgi:hypothetical protein